MAANNDSQRMRPELFNLQVINIYLYQGLSVWLSAGCVNLMNIYWLGLKFFFFLNKHLICLILNIHMLFLSTRMVFIKSEFV